MRIACNIITDIMPLYCENECSEETKALVEEHVASCSKCQRTLNTMEESLKVEEVRKADSDIQVIKKITQQIRKDRFSAFLWGALLLSVATVVVCIVAYNIIGVSVAPDGRLIEAFGLIPIAWLFTFISIGLGLFCLHVAC